MMEPVTTAGGTNQAVKGLAIARGYLRDSGIDAIYIAQFTAVEIKVDVPTAIRLLVERRGEAQPAQ